MHSSVEPVQAEYIRQLSHSRPALEDQLADVYQVLTAVTDGGYLSEEGPLGSARAAYVAYLRESQLTFDELVADVAAVCACVFIQEFVA
jgi:hypothetical protein